MAKHTIRRVARHSTSTGLLTLERSGNRWAAVDGKGNVWHHAEWGSLRDLTLALGWEGWTVIEQRVPVRTIDRDPLGVAKFFPRPKGF